MGCCLLTVLGLLIPRITMVIIWLFSDWFGRAYDTWIWPLLGFFFLPYTTLIYMAAMLNAGEMTTGWLALTIAAILVDIGHWGGGTRARRKR